MKSNVNQGSTAKTLHNTLSDCAHLFKNLRFLTVTVSEIVEQLKKVHTITDNVLGSSVEYFSKTTCHNVLQCTNSRLCVMTNFQAVI